MSMMHEITAGLAGKKSKRVGRGESSGKGKTCGRGTKAAHGGDVHWKPLHEGGQTPLCTAGSRSAASRTTAGRIRTTSSILVNWNRWKLAPPWMLPLWPSPA